MFCKKCGSNIPEGAGVCPICGETSLAGDYTPISMWGYFGYELLFMIPLVGFIMQLVFAFGGTQNINLRNFARSYFCVYIVLFVIVLMFGAFLSNI